MPEETLSRVVTFDISPPPGSNTSALAISATTSNRQPRAYNLTIEDQSSPVTGGEYTRTVTRSFEHPDGLAPGDTIVITLNGQERARIPAGDYQRVIQQGSSNVLENYMQEIARHPDGSLPSLQVFAARELARKEMRQLQGQISGANPLGNIRLNGTVEPGVRLTPVAPGAPGGPRSIGD
jgi:hypothetical protein